MQKLTDLLSTEIIEHVDELILVQLVEASSDERSEGRKTLVTSLKDVFKEEVRTENIQSATNEVKQKIKYTDLDNDLKKSLISLNNFAVVENSIFDAEKTM